MVSDGEPAGSVGAVVGLGGEWTFKLYDGKAREVLALAFLDERNARQAVKMMQDILARAASVSSAEEFDLAKRFASELQLLYEFDWS